LTKRKTLRRDRIYIAGDDDQAIYQWSGADVKYFLGIQGKINILTHSYRLPNDVLTFAKYILRQMSRRIEKNYEGTGIPGRVKQVNTLEEIKINPEETYMFLSRNNVFLKDIEEELMKRALVYSMKGELSAKQSELDTIIAYERLRRERTGADDEVATLRAKGFKKMNLDLPWYDCIDWPNEKIAYFRRLIGNKVPIGKTNLLVSTIHAVKGGEADHVVLLTDVTRTVKHNMDHNPDSEHRAFYVGCTRAKKSLTIVNPRGKHAYLIDPTAWWDRSNHEEE
jgi:superfamily I DNA/RNA helicase